jgi:hypothetical protein
MQKKKSNKLSLQKKAISKLDAKSLRGVQGGGLQTQDSNCNCSPLCPPPPPSEDRRCRFVG